MSVTQKLFYLLTGLSILSFWFIKTFVIITIATLKDNRRIVLADPTSTNPSLIVNYR